MTFSAGLLRAALLLAVGAALCGCTPSAPGDEEKEQFFLEGKSRAKNRDFPGAVESFEKAVEVNPRSGPAHFELACLYDQKEGDPAAAVYHYGRFLKLSPNSGKEDMVKTRILACKQQLAQTVSLGDVSQKQQRELEQLLEENKRLRDEVEKWRASAGRPQSPTNSVSNNSSAPRTAAASVTNPGAGLAPATGGSNRATSSAAPSSRTYVIKSGDTAMRIAQRYGIKWEALLAANPRLNPRRMPVGQTITIPAP